MQIKEDVFHLSLQPQWIASPEICVILHILRKPNSIIVSLFIQNSFKFLTSLPPRRPIFYFSAQFQDVKTGFFLQILLKKLITSIEQYVLHILAFLPFSFRQKFSYFVLREPWTPFVF